MAKKRGRSRRDVRGQAARGAGVQRGTDDQAPAHRRHPLDPWLLGLAVAGLVLTAYLTLSAWLGAHPAFCGADSGCDLVQSSRWSTLLGLPMSLWGFATYALLARSAWRLRTRPSAWRFAIWVAFAGAGVSWFLTVVSVLEIEAACAWCLTSFAIMNALLAGLLLRRPAHMPEHRWGTALPAPVAVTALLVVVLQLHFSGVFDAAAGPEDPYLKALAVHLRESGAKFYGAYWCPHCKEQKELFGASVARLPYVECTPEGRKGPVDLACRDQDISDYPTWIIDGRKHPGVIKPRELARLTGFPFDGTASR